MEIEAKDFDLPEIEEWSPNNYWYKLPNIYRTTNTNIYTTDNTYSIGFVIEHYRSEPYSVD